MVASRLALPGLVLVFLFAIVTSHDRCEIPTWPAELGEDLFAANRGKLLLVALMKGYCHYCVVQAQGLEYMKAYLAGQGMSDIEMVIVNGGEPISRDNIHNLQEAVSLPIIQDTENHVMFDQVVGGDKDDFVVYDKCGQRAFFIPSPYSYLGHNFTVRVLRFTYHNLHRCECDVGSQIYNPHNQMMGDQPLGGAAHEVRMDTSELNCPLSYYWCRSFARFLRYRRYGRFLGRGPMDAAMPLPDTDAARNLNRFRFPTVRSRLETLHRLN